LTSDVSALVHPKFGVARSPISEKLGLTATPFPLKFVSGKYVESPSWRYGFSPKVYQRLGSRLCLKLRLRHFAYLSTNFSSGLKSANYTDLLLKLWYPLHIAGMAEATTFKFGVQSDYKEYY